MCVAWLGWSTVVLGVERVGGMVLAGGGGDRGLGGVESYPVAMRLGVEVR